METYYVYILRCSDHSYYTGVTSDIENRLFQHQSGSFPDSYTHNRRPVELVFYCEFNNMNEAISFEKQVKGWSRRRRKLLLIIIGICCLLFQFVKTKVIIKILKKIKLKKASTPLSRTNLQIHKNEPH